MGAPTVHAKPGAQMGEFVILAVVRAPLPNTVTMDALSASLLEGFSPNQPFAVVSVDVFERETD